MTATQFAPVLTLVDSDRPDDNLTVDELGSRIVGMSGRLAAATCRWLLLVAEFDRREGYVRFGLHSSAYWLSHHCGIARRTAVAHLRVARALAAFPALAAEMSAGRLSYSQVRAIARVPRDGEHAVVADLITAAQHGSAAQLETLIRGLRVADAAENPQLADEYVRSGWEQSGHRRLSARLEVDRGKVLDAALKEVARAQGVSSADALVLMAEWALAIVHDERAAPRDLRGDERAAVVIHIDADSYPVADEQDTDTDAATDADSDGARPAGRAPAGRVDGGPGLSRAVVERLACAGRIRPILEARDGRVLDLGRSTRVVSTRQFRALLQRDRHCTHPGCSSTRRLEAHHVRHWLHGGRTDMDNLALLCEAHHKAHHAGEFMMIPAGRQRWRFVRSDGRELLRTVYPDDFADADAAIDTEHRTEFGAAGTRWDGQRLDHRYAVSVLAVRRSDNARRAG